MDQNDPLYAVLDFILNQATTAQLEVIGEALKRRSADAPAGGKGLDPRRMAQRLSRNIVQRLGPSLDVPQIARRIVRDLIKSKEPGIQDHEVEILLDNWLPGTRRRKGGAEAGGPAGPAGAQPAAGSPAGLPPDALISMVATFLAAERGTLSVQEAGELPEGWQERYWQSFPPAVRQAIEELRRGALDATGFWTSLIGLLQR